MLVVCDYPSLSFCGLSGYTLRETAFPLRDSHFHLVDIPPLLGKDQFPPGDRPRPPGERLHPLFTWPFPQGARHYPLGSRLQPLGERRYPQWTTACPLREIPNPRPLPQQALNMIALAPPWMPNASWVVEGVWGAERESPRPGALAEAILMTVD